jgi:hypothetical protein
VLRSGAFCGLSGGFTTDRAAGRRAKRVEGPRLAQRARGAAHDALRDKQTRIEPKPEFVGLDEATQRASILGQRTQNLRCGSGASFRQWVSSRRATEAGRAVPERTSGNFVTGYFDNLSR